MNIETVRKENKKSMSVKVPDDKENPSRPKMILHKTRSVDQLNTNNISINNRNG